MDEPTLAAEVPRSGRIPFFDEVRGVDIVLMVAFHAFFTIGWVFDGEWGRVLFQFFAPVEPFFAALFILLCGMSCHLSRSNLKRGLLLAACAAAMSLFLWLFMPEAMIWFGILHFLAVSILLFMLLKPLLARIPPAIGIAACALLMLMTWWFPSVNNPDGIGGYIGIRGLLAWQLPGELIANNWLYPLGLGYLGGTDYFPLLPWFFCFLAGSFLGVWVKQGKMPRWMYRSRLPVFGWLGRHTLVIYVLHQPVIFALCWITTTLMGLF